MRSLCLQMVLIHLRQTYNSTQPKQPHYKLRLTTLRITEPASVPEGNRCPRCERLCLNHSKR